MSRPLPFLALLCAVLAGPAGAAERGRLAGRVTAAWTGLPVAGAEVVAAADGTWARTGPAGRFVLELSPGRHTLFLRAPGLAPASLVRQEVQAGVTTETRAELLPDAAPGTGAPATGALGVPPRRRPPGPPSEPVVLPSWPGVTWLQVPEGPLPDRIRVGRRFERSCSGHEVRRIDEIDLNSYTRGVVNAEVGVFRSVQGGVDAAFETWAAFGVAARSYALWFYLRQPDAEFHIDDTACNQVYKDQRDPDVDRAVDSARGLVLVRDDGTRTIDKFEYASSCGRHGSQPEYQDALVPDDTGGHACVGSWCGHDNCAGHAVNPAVPDLGRCLVRGICQWGAVERSQRGDDWEAILAHYQPNLEVLGPGGGPDPAEPGTLVGFVREEDVAAGPGIAGAVVEVRDGPAATTNGDGFYRLEELEPGEVVLTATADGYHPADAQALVQSGVTRWRSFSLLPLGGEPDAGGAPDVDAPGPGPDVGPDAGEAAPDTGTGPAPVVPAGSAGEVSGSYAGDPACGCRLSAPRPYLPLLLRR